MDYLPVPIVPEILRAKVSVFVELYRKTQQLERLNRELEQRVAERTAELEDASRRKDEFLAVLAHELRNPLAAIRTAARHRRAAPTRRAAALDAVGGDHRPPGRAPRPARRRSRGRLAHHARHHRAAARSRQAIADVVSQAVETSQPLIDERRHTLAIGPIDRDARR